MISTPKYHNTRVYLDPHTGKVTGNRVSPLQVKFDSKLEYGVYRAICRQIPCRWVELQPKILTKPATSIYPESYWRADFAIPKLGLIVEAKGLPQREWLLEMQMWQSHYPYDFSKLVVVSTMRRVIDKAISSITPWDLEQLLKERVRALISTL
ncbi:MAG TPA: hypothetical protein V6C65_08580 [Allocoleopsis sp.]